MHQTHAALGPSTLISTTHEKECQDHRHPSPSGQAVGCGEGTQLNWFNTATLSTAQVPEAEGKDSGKSRLTLVACF